MEAAYTVWRKGISETGIENKVSVGKRPQEEFEPEYRFNANYA